MLAREYEKILSSVLEISAAGLSQAFFDTANRIGKLLKEMHAIDTGSFTLQTGKLDEVSSGIKKLVGQANELLQSVKGFEKSLPEQPLSKTSSQSSVKTEAPKQQAN
ncbi:MAG: hypothetical protein AAGG80_04855 [Pseudomonadota bacterium]